jgi:hypothetical protein
MRCLIPATVVSLIVLAVQTLAASPACSPPTAMAASPEETAWQLFVASTCPVGESTSYPYVTWEKWIEQNQLYQAQQAPLAAETQNSTRRFHASVLAGSRKKKGAAFKALVATTGCNSEPSIFGRVLCEEVRLNPASLSYVTANNLYRNSGQALFVKDGKPFVFTAPSIEIKADWIKLKDCSPLEGVHVETIGGDCYALAGMHLISKLIDKWVWATFEPQNITTNARRCQELGCSDNWGSAPPTSSGASTNLTPALQSLMTQAGLAKEWMNYRLDGVQIDFFKPDGKTPTILGNSVIEGENAVDKKGYKWTMNHSSCITCHSQSAIDAKGTDSIQTTGAPFVVGGQQPIAAGFEARDFVWSLLLAKRGTPLP